MEDELIHIAFADDHSLVRKGIISMLLPLGGIVVDIEASNGQELLDKLKDAAKLPDICIIDINMPLMSGHTALMEIRKTWPELKTLILTAISLERYVIQMMQAGANGYLLKDCPIEEVKEALISISKNGYYYSSCANSTLFYLIETKAIKRQPFTDNDFEMLRYFCTELTYLEIAEKTKTSVSRVESCRDRLFAKLNLNSRVDLALFAVQNGIVPLEVIPLGKSIVANNKIK